MIMVNYKIHRVRFVPYVPQAIHCLAVEGRTQPRIAISRADSSIEIWNIEENWYMERKIYGCEKGSVEALIWSGLRLFSSGLHGEITEWNLDKLNVKARIDSFGGAVWTLAVNHEQTLMAAGCEDGCVRLFDITSEDIEYARVFSKQEGRILSLCWHKDGRILVTGGSDGTIRVYEVSTGQARLHITLDNSTHRKTLVWSLAVTSDFTIISCDSLGKTQFWDGKLGTLIKSFNVHIADVLAVCINQQEDTVFASGVDNKLMQFKLLTDKDGTKTWSRSNSTRAHTHDIRALAMIEKDDQSVLVSGGVDTNIIVYSTSKYGSSDPRKIPAYPMRPVIHLSCKAQILMFQNTTSLHFWKLGKTVNEESCHLESNPSHILKIEAKSPNHIVCAALSDDALWTAFSDVHHISLFKIHLEDFNSSSAVQRVKFLPEDILPAHHMKFTKDCSKLLTVTDQKSLQIIHLDSITVETVEFPAVDSTINHRGLDPYSPVTTLAVSPDGTLCASADTSRYIQVFDIQNTKHYCTLPRFSKQMTAMAFQPDTNILALANTNKEVFMFNIEKMKMTEWSKNAAKSGLPQQWQTMPTKVVNIVFNPYSKDTLLLHSHDMFVLLDTIKPLPSKTIKLFETKRDRFEARAGSKRKHSGEFSMTKERQKIEQSEAFKICQKYQPLLFLGVNDDGSLVTVERSWLSIMESLPPTLHRKRYGT